MESIRSWLDRRLYPDYGDNWDNQCFRVSLQRYMKPEFHILDYGAGRGRAGELDLRDDVEFVAGVDPDQAVLGNPFLHEAKILPLPEGTIPYDDETFDLVFSANVIEHVPEPVACFREIKRVLKPGGMFLAKTPNKYHYVPSIARMTPQSFHEFINRRRGRADRDTFPTLYRCNTPSRVRACAASAGLDVASVTLLEGRPEYLRVFPLLYLAGYLYERAVNMTERLAALRSVIIFALKKPCEQRALLTGACSLVRTAEL